MKTLVIWQLPFLKMIIKEFALTSVSPRAYKFVRKALHLPHPASKRSWCANINCEPGLLQKPLYFILNKVTEAQKYCFILLDEMSIACKECLFWHAKFCYP